MARATFMHDLWSYGSLVTEWPFLPWGLGGESSCCKSGLLHSIKTPAGSCTRVIFFEKKRGQMLFLVSVTISRLKLVMYLFFFFNRVFTSNYLLKLWHKTHTHPKKGTEILLNFLQLLVPVSRYSLNEGKGWIIYLKQRSCNQIIDINFCFCSWSDPCSDVFPFVTVT